MYISMLPALTSAYENAPTIATQITSLNALNKAVIALAPKYKDHPSMVEAVAVYNRIRGEEVRTYCRIVNRTKFNNTITNWK